MAEKRCVLYIEDDAKARILVTKVLSREFEVLTAQNGLEGLDQLKARTPDLVLTDINLPDLSGEVIATRIRAICGAQIPIVAITADTDKQVKDRALAAGCTGFITKPIDVRSLPDTIHDYLGGREEHLDEDTHHRVTRDMQARLTNELELRVRQLQEDNAELRNLERAKTAFLTQVSHELRTPLTVLSGYVQMLRQQLNDDPNVRPDYRTLADLSMQGIKRLHALMNDIVVMARLASNQTDAFMAPTTLGVVAHEAIEEYRAALEKRRLKLIEQGNCWSALIMADSTLMRIALSNLISNAIKATPDGGTITVSIGRTNEILHIKIMDTGVGIHPDQLRLLFKPFYTTIDVSRGRTSKTDFMGMGMGIGLTIVSRIVHAHNGRVWAESSGYDEEHFPGATLHVLLPGLETPETAAEKAVNAEESQNAVL